MNHCRAWKRNKSLRRRQAASGGTPKHSGETDPEPTSLEVSVSVCGLLHRLTDSSIVIRHLGVDLELQRRPELRRASASTRLACERGLETLKQTPALNHRWQRYPCWDAHLSEKVSVSAPERPWSSASFLVSVSALISNCAN